MNRILFIIILLLSIQKTFQQQNTNFYQQNISFYEQTDYNDDDDDYIFILKFLILFSAIIYF